MTRSAAFDAWVAEARAVPIEEIARARAPALKRQGRELVGPCPACGGSDRFSVNLQKGVFLCRQGGGAGVGGDVIALVEYLDACDFLAACEILTGRPPPGSSLGAGAETEEERQARAAEREQLRAENEARAQAAEREEVDYRAREIARCRAIWREGLAWRGTIVEAYFALRRIDAPDGAHLRFHPELPLYGEAVEGAGSYGGANGAGPKRAKERPELHRGPALVAAILGPDGRFSGVHMTWLDPRLAEPGGLARLDAEGSPGTVKGLVWDPAAGDWAPARKARGSTKGGRIELVRWSLSGANGQQPERAAPSRSSAGADESASPAGAGEEGPKRLFLGEGRETVLAAWCELAEQAPEVAAESAFWSAIDLGNLGGKAAASLAHPTLTVTDRLGRTRPASVAGPEPDMSWPAIPIPDTVRHLYLLGDGDSEPFATRCALTRAALRYGRLAEAANRDLDCRLIMAPAGCDWNDVRRGRFRVAEAAA